MADPFDLLGRGDLEGLRAELARDPGLARARHASGASLLAFTAYMRNPEATRLVRPLAGDPDPFEAIILGEAAPLEAALAGGWDPNGLSPDGFAPLALAAFFANAAAFGALLPLTIDVNRQAENPQQVAALHAAVAARQPGMVEQLLRAGADPDLQQADGITALHAAAQHGDAMIVGLLLLFSADPAIADAQGRTAADHARAGEHAWLAERLDPAMGAGV